MPSIGPLELIVVLVIVLLIFGPKRLPGLGRQLGSGMREFKDGITGKHKDDLDEDEDEDADAVAQRRLEPAPAVHVEPAAEDAPRATGDTRADG